MNHSYCRGCLTEYARQRRDRLKSDPAWLDRQRKNQREYEKRRPNKAARAEANRARYQKNKEAHKDRAIKKMYGIGIAEYRALLDAQGGVCAIPGCGGAGMDDKRGLAVDHCHVTGKVRGLLCMRCNVAIGHCSDDPARLEALALYLRKTA